MPQSIAIPMISDCSVPAAQEFSPPSPNPERSWLCPAGQSVREQPFPLSNVERSRRIPTLEFAPQRQSPGLRQEKQPGRSGLPIIGETLLGVDSRLRPSNKEQVSSGPLRS